MFFVHKTQNYKKYFAKRSFYYKNERVLFYVLHPRGESAKYKFNKSICQHFKMGLSQLV